MASENKFTVRPPKLRRGLITAGFAALSVISGTGIYFADEYALFLGIVCAIFALVTIAMTVFMFRFRIIVDGDTITEIPSFGKKIKHCVADITGVHIYDEEFNKQTLSLGLAPVTIKREHKIIYIAFTNGGRIELLYRCKNAPLFVALLNNKGVEITQNTIDNK